MKLQAYEMNAEEMAVLKGIVKTSLKAEHFEILEYVDGEEGFRLFDFNLDNGNVVTIQEDGSPLLLAYGDEYEITLRQATKLIRNNVQHGIDQSKYEVLTLVEKLEG